MLNFFYTTSNYDNKDIFWDILDTLKDKDRDKNKADLDIEEVALMFPTGPLVLGQIVPRLDRPEEREDTVHLFYFLFRHCCFFDDRCT